MILKHVKHFLTAEGIAYFDEWFNTTINLLKKSPGFICAHYMQLDPAENKLHFIMYFEDEAALQRWAHNDAHHEALARLSPYMEKEWVAEQHELS